MYRHISTRILNRSVSLQPNAARCLARRSMHSTPFAMPQPTYVEEYDPASIRTGILGKLPSGIQVEVREMIPIVVQDINKPNMRGETQLVDLILKATKNSNEEQHMAAFLKLLEHDFIDVNVPHQHTKYTALHILVNNNSASSGRLSHAPRLGMIKHLMERGANVNAQSHHQQTPLHFAAIRGDRAAVELFLAHPEIDVAIVDSKGNTALDLAKLGGFSDVIVLIDARHKKSTSTTNKP